MIKTNQKYVFCNFMYIYFHSVMQLIKTDYEKKKEFPLEIKTWLEDKAFMLQR